MELFWNDKSFHYSSGAIYCTKIIFSAPLEKKKKNSNITNMKLEDVTDGNIEYAHGEGLISTIEVAQAIQGLACLTNGKLKPGEQPCIENRSKHNLGQLISNDLTQIPNSPARTLNENCLKCEEFLPARNIFANRVVQLTSS